jgi:uncharacterized protein YggE
MPMPMPMPPRVPLRNMAVPDRMDGITVAGSGYASAQAADATVTLHLSSRSNALTFDRQTLQPVVEALVKAGADASSVQLPPYLVGNAKTNNATITASVHHPTLQMLQQGMVTLANAFAGMPDVFLNNAEIRLSADNCTSLQRRAEANAIASARSNAAFVAQQIGGRVGDVLAVNALGAAMGNDNACSFAYSIGPWGSSFQQSPAEMLTVKIYSSVTMRFAIKR